MRQLDFLLQVDMEINPIIIQYTTRYNGMGELFLTKGTSIEKHYS